MRRHIPGADVLVLLLACTTADPKDAAPPDDTGDTADTGAPSPSLLTVSGYFSGEVVVLDRATGEVVGELFDVPGAQTVTPAPDGTWVVCAELENEVRRYDPDSFLPLGTLVADDPGTPEDETGGLHGPTAAVHGPDGLLYVASFEDDRVLRYADGVYLDDFVASGAGGLIGPDIGMTFGPDGTLYVPGWTSDAVHRYAADGTPLGTVLGPEHGISRPRGLAFAPDGALWVSTEGDGHLGRLDPDGTYAEVATVRGATGLAWEPEGTILVAAGTAGTVRRYSPDGEELAVLASETKIDGITALGVFPG